MLQAFMGLRAIHGLFDEADKWLQDQLGVPTCIPNCGLCCGRNAITIHSIEASLIISYLMGTGQLHLIDAARSWLLDQQWGVTTYEGIPRGVVTGKLREEWNTLTHSSCIFYDSERKICPVHPLRPLSCRAYGVTKVPSPYCPRPLGAGESRDTRKCVGSPLVIKRAVAEFKDDLKRNPHWAQMGFLPTMILRQAREKEFRGLIEDNKIASAKLVGTDFSTQALYQDETESQWSPDPTRNIIAS